MTWLDIPAEQLLIEMTLLSAIVLATVLLASIGSALPQVVREKKPLWPPVTDPCTLSPDPGPCEALIPKYFYDSERQVTFSKRILSFPILRAEEAYDELTLPFFGTCDPSDMDLTRLVSSSSGVDAMEWFRFIVLKNAKRALAILVTRALIRGPAKPASFVTFSTKK